MSPGCYVVPYSLWHVSIMLYCNLIMSISKKSSMYFIQSHPESFKNYSAISYIWCNITWQKLCICTSVPHTKYSNRESEPKQWSIPNQSFRRRGHIYIYWLCVYKHKILLQKRSASKWHPHSNQQVFLLAMQSITNITNWYTTDLKLQRSSITVKKMTRC